MFIYVLVNYNMYICVCIYREREKERDIGRQIHIFALYVATKYGKYPFSHRQTRTENTAKRASLRSSSLGNGTPVSSVEVTWPTTGSEGMVTWMNHEILGVPWCVLQMLGFPLSTMGNLTERGIFRNLQVVLGVTKLKK
jgi:hypothetical protein